MGAILWKRLVASVLAVTVSSLALVTQARAEPLPEAVRPSPSSDTIVLTLRGEDGPLTVELYHPRARPGDDLPFARCTTPCFARLPRGRYKLFVHETSETRSGSRTMDLGESSSLTISPDSYGQRWTGLTLGVAGAVAIFAGFFVLLQNLCIDEGGSGCGGHADSGLGAALVLGGLVAEPVGWVIFGRSFAPDVDKRPLAPEYGTGTATRERRTVGLGFKMAF